MPRNLVSALWGLFLAVSSSTAAAQPSLKDLTPAVRTRIDRLAAEHLLDTLRQERRNMAGNVSLWALSHLALAPEDEREHAESVHKQILAHEKIVATPPAAQRVFRKLLDNLPPHLKPDAFAYTLTVLDQTEANAFTIGGGYVYISRSLLDALTEPERGETALAFILGHQLGHIGLLHCRHGWQTFELQQEIQKGIDIHIAREHLREVLHTGVASAGDRVTFLYTRRQVYEADLFAWQLCRNAGLSVDHALDGLRWLVLVEQPRIRTEETYRPNGEETGGEGPPALLRLKRLFMERDGQVDDPHDTYGLLVWDAQSDSFERCGPKSIGVGEKPIIFVHGFHGSTRTFRDYLQTFAQQPEFRGRKLLVFRYPNNASLSRCGQYLHNEMRRAVMAPEKAMFVCHSAGGLVFRWYAEVKKAPFDHAILLSTPNEGSSLTSLKYLADLGAFVDELKMNGPGALARMIPEGEGQVMYDVHGDSLFLRYLGHNAELAKRYHVFSGDYLRPLQVAGLGVGIAAAKRAMKNRVLPHIESAVLRRQSQRRIDRWHLPREISHGDLVVSVESALLKDAGRSTKTHLNHEEFKSDEQVIRDVVESIQGR